MPKMLKERGKRKGSGRQKNQSMMESINSSGPAHVKRKKDALLLKLKRRKEEVSRAG
jgi:hypothetical protein